MGSFIVAMTEVAAALVAQFYLETIVPRVLCLEKLWADVPSANIPNHTNGGGMLLGVPKKLTLS